MQMLRILTFNWHDPYLHMFAQTGHEIFVGDWMQRADGTRGWDVEKRPLPDNLTLIKQPQEAVVYLKDGEIDVAVCHTLQDLSFVAPFDVPTVYLTHNALQNDGLNDPAGMAKLRNEIATFLKGRNGVFAAISPMKLKSWDLEGFVVRPGIDLDAYGGYTGGKAVALSVGNLFVERDHMLGYRYMKEILDGVPHRLVGENPQLPEAKKAKNWDDLKAAFRSCRVYVNTTVEEFEDGYNLGMLEAMATGMPVVSWKNATSPIRDGENGFVSGDTGTLKTRVQDLLEDAELAKRLGMAARETVAQEFSVAAFVDNWNRIFEACLEQHRKRAMPAQEVPVSVDLSIQPTDLYPFTGEDVAAFLDVDDLDRIVVPRLKLDRVGTGYLCDLFLGNLDTGQPMVWQGLEVYPGGVPRIVWPAYLKVVPIAVQQILNHAIGTSLTEMEKQGQQAQSVYINLREPGEFVFRVGEDRVTPGDARSEIYLHHAKRYVFARQFCAGKQVVDLGAGTGYGTRMLGRDAKCVVGLDLCAEAQQFAQKMFGKENVRRLASDVRSVGLQDDQFDVAVCFEAIEHIVEHEALLHEVRRLLRPDGIFVVSTPNKKIYDLPQNANPYHVGMLELDDFRDLLSPHFGDVVVYGQKRAEQGKPYYEAFDFRDGASDGDEVFVAVCSMPKAAVLPSEARELMSAPLVRVNAKSEQPGGRRLKILFSHVSNPISMGRYYVDSLRKAHDVLTCGPVIDDAELREWRKAETQHALKRADAGEVEKMGLISRLAEPCDIPMPRGRVDVRTVLSQLPAGWKPDLFVWIDSATAFLPMGLEKLDCPSVSITVDTHTGQMDWRKEYAKMFGHVFLVHYQHIADFQAFGCAHVGWLPPACSATVHGKIPSDKAYDIGFVGQTHRQWHPHRVRLLQRLKDAGLDVHVESKILEEMTLFNSRSRIVFNRSLNGDLNMRVFEAMCAGSLVLTDRLPPEARLEDLLKDREHLVVYDEENLEALARHYLDHEAEREAIAEAGRQAVLAAHTYDHRADEMIAQVLGKEGIARCVAEPTEAGLAGRQNWGKEAPASVSVTRGADTKESAVAELAEYTGESVEEVLAKLPKTGPALAKEWREKDRTTQEEVGPQAQVEAAPPVSVDQTHFDSPEKVQSFLTAWQGPVKLNLGCGEDRRDRYINVDAYVPSADLKMDIFKLVFADGTVDEIFSSHMLEHLGKYEVPHALAEWNRVLKPGGVLGLNLPDLEWAMDQWLKVPEEHRWGWAVDTIYGLQTHDGEYHKSGFTVGRVEQLLEEAGFGKIRVSWVWSHGLRCLWVEAVRPGVGEVPGVERSLEMRHFEGQFPVDLSSLSPYTAEDCEAFFGKGDWEIGLVSFEHLPMDGADYTVNVAVKKGKDQMVLQGMRMFDVKGSPYLVFPDYLKDQSESVRETLGQAIGEALGQKLNDPAYQDGTFVVARFNERGDLGLEQTGERVIPGLTDYSLYIPHMKRYLLAERFAEGARVLDAGCGTGYGAKRLARVAEHVDAVDVCEEAIGFAGRTYADEKVNWQVADLLAFEPEEGAYDLVTSFEVIEHLSEAEIPVYLDCLQRALKPGGVALISTPNHLVAQQWDNPFHKTEMTLDAFRNVLTPVFDDVAVLGQTVWCHQTEVPGQCTVSGRVTDEDDMFIAVCTKRVVSGKRRSDIPPRVSIVMPLYNQVEYTAACLEGLEKVRGKVPYELVLVDNGSTDGTGDLLDGMEDQARVIRNGQNLGFAKGNNLGAKEARGEYLLFLNNDTIPHRGWLDALVAEADSDALIGIVGARLLYPDTGKIQHAGIEIVNGVPDHVHRHQDADDPAVKQGRDLDMVTGACLMIRRDLFERLGGFDEGYVNGVEDVDLCLRARDLGFRVRYCAEAVLDHHEGKSEGRFDHVRPNLERFGKRWNGRFDGQSRFVPEVPEPESISQQNGVSTAGSETAALNNGLRG
ncbi:MAG: methyltransferase domain-containing protein, partial [bacterium]|nr:methyltransferase domain-containing protein [bacterium]